MRKLIHTLLLGLSASAAMAQTNTVTGTITDCHGNVVVGQTVFIYTDSVMVDTTMGVTTYVTSTNAYGVYSYDVPYSGGTQPLYIVTNDIAPPYAASTIGSDFTASGGSFTGNFILGCAPDSIHTTIWGYVYDCNGSPLGGNFVAAVSDSSGGDSGGFYEAYAYSEPTYGGYMIDVAYSGAATYPFPVIVTTPNPAPYYGFTTDTVYINDTAAIHLDLHTSCPPFPCTASFGYWYDSTGLSGNDTVYLALSYTSVHPGAATITWDFGDSNTGSGMYTTHEYSSDGVYTLCVNIENDVDSCTTSYCHDINISMLERSSGFVLKTFKAGTLGIKTPAKKQESFNVYPNPATSMLNIQTTTDIKTAKLFDMSGRQVMTQSVSGVQGNMSLDIHDIENGSYILSLYNQNNELLHTHTVLKH